MVKPTPLRIQKVKSAGIGSAGIGHKMPTLRKPVFGQKSFQKSLLREKPVLKMKGTPAAPLFEPGSRYQILDVIDEGGAGVVSRAWDSLLKMDVAIKMLRPEIARDREAMARLKSEAALVMKLSHENIVRLYNMDVKNGQVFLVMEYVRGRTLAVISQQMGPLAFPAVLDIAHSSCSALAYAHSNGVLHRDIKPDNLMVNEAMCLKLLDFGTALKMVPGGKSGEYLEGSPGYMSPEERFGHPLDARTDVFSLAVVLCELLSGQRAFPDTEIDPRRYLRDPDGIGSLPAPIGEVLLRGMAPDFNERYRSAAAFYEAFEQAMKPLLG